ncbi:MAG: response regulator transcription factor, partial [Chlorobiales bacterium]|nr:response regulator transcription factor [Chlorobiales bacterium]
MREFPHILALEGSPSFTKRLKKELEHLQLSCDLRTVKSPQSFLQAIKTETPDALIVGSASESSDPMSVLVSVRALNASIPVMVVLEKSDLETGIQCLKSGATGVVPKSKHEQLALLLKEAFNVPN